MKNRLSTSNLKLRALVILQIFWIGMICILGAWWGSLVLKQSAKIAELEVAAGLASGEAHQHWERTHRMVFWESSTFIVLILVSGACIFWFYWRDMLRARSVQAFFASVTHELRTPLTSIRLQAESIAESFSESSSERHLVDRLMEDTMRLESQVERTLELARVEGGGPVFVQSLQLKPALDRMVLGWSEAYANRIEIASEVQDVTIVADPTSLQVILKNLLENSLKHSGKGKVRVRIRTDISPDAVSLILEDNGEGFSGNGRELGRLFYRGSSSQGTGVGLYLVQILMKKMGGSAGFRAHQREASASASVLRERLPMVEKISSRILVVEDEKNVGLTLVERLRKEGFDVVWATTSAEADLEMGSRKFDLVLMDVGLPDGSGFDVAARLRKLQPGAAILFLTAFGSPENRVRGLELGAEDYVVKPFHLKELLLRVRNGLKRARYLSSGIGETDERVQIGRASVHFGKFEATVDDQIHSLTHKECALLRLLFERRGNVVSRDEILNHVWSEDEFPTSRTIDNFIMRLRRLVETDVESPLVIRSVRGVGYQLI